MIDSVKLLLLFLWFTSCRGAANSAQEPVRLVGGPCEGCEAVFEYGDPEPGPVDTLPDFWEEGTRIRITGTVYRENGETPAEGVILYIWHTDQGGEYANRGDETGWGRRHGYIRGWTRTGRDGVYTYYTLMPGTYPSRSAPAHIHSVILEPGGRYYWVEDYYFSGDPLLTEREIAPESPRGGSGLISPEEEDGILTGHRDIILGRNIPGYR